MAVLASSTIAELRSIASVVALVVSADNNHTSVTITGALINFVEWRRIAIYSNATCYNQLARN